MNPPGPYTNLTLCIGFDLRTENYYKFTTLNFNLECLVFHPMPLAREWALSLGMSSVRVSPYVKCRNRAPSHLGSRTVKLAIEKVLLAGQPFRWVYFIESLKEVGHE
jgi:hypothetical protein